MKFNKLPEQRLVRERLSYDPETGHFTWKIGHQKVKAGQVAGSLNTDGYRVISIGGKNYHAHRIAYEFVHGEGSISGLQVDHINGVRTDNRAANLRLATNADNRNNSSLNYSNLGIRGVFKEMKRGRPTIRAVVYSNGKRVWAKYFRTVEEAVEARNEQLEKYHGSFASKHNVDVMRDHC